MLIFINCIASKQATVANKKALPHGRAERKESEEMEEKNKRKEVLEALENWIIETSKDKTSVKSAIEALPKVAEVYLKYYLSL